MKVCDRCHQELSFPVPFVLTDGGAKRCELCRECGDELDRLRERWLRGEPLGPVTVRYEPARFPWSKAFGFMLAAGWVGLIWIFAAITTAGIIRHLHH